MLKLRILLPLTIVIAAIAAEEPDVSVQQTLQNAIDGERAAQSRYAVFAEQAIREGYPGAASLFRAAAAAENIHENVFRTLL
ncbi:MAG TPA: ferritin family protein [Thermoanaerobaculia bacterium]